MMIRSRRSAHWLLRFFLVVLAIICLWQIGVLLYQLNQKVTIEKVNIQSVTTDKFDDDYQVYQIPNLFEATSIDNEASISKIENAADTPINVSFPSIQLLGTILNSDSSQSLAILLLDNKQKLLGMGEVVGNSKATITQITDNEITLHLSGRNKIFKIPPRLVDPQSDSLSSGFPSDLSDESQFDDEIESNDVSEVSDANIADIDEPLARFQSALLEKPSRFTEYVKFNPVFENNVVIAYRISAGKDTEVFQALGLKQNDLVTAISSANFNIQLSNSDALLSLWSKIASADSFIMHIEREGQQYEIVVDLQ